MTDVPRTGGKKLPHNFVIAWRDQENGPVLGYAVAEVVVFFPANVTGGTAAKGERNVADAALSGLFASGAERKMTLQAVPLPNGVVAGSSFRADIAGMSGDVFYQD